MVKALRCSRCANETEFLEGRCALCGSVLVRRAPLTRQPSGPERAFTTLWQQLYPDLLPPAPEYRFDLGRGWRFDFAWPVALVAVEIEGGGYNRGRHHRPQGFEDDCAKYNHATAVGWRVFRLTPSMLETDPAGWLNMVARLVAAYTGKV